MTIEDVVRWLRRYLRRRTRLSVSGSRTALFEETGVYLSDDHWQTVEHDLREGR